MDKAGKPAPRNLIEAIRYFADLDVCTEFVAQLRWADGPVCDRCGGVESYYLAKRRVWKCKACSRQYSVKVGTIFEDSPLGLDKWLPAVWLIANSKNGISSHELGRALGITQKSAWFMLHRIRLAMASGSFAKFTGAVEVDETFIGGLGQNMHKDKRMSTIRGGGGHDKSIVIGALNRGGEVRAQVIADTTAATLQGFVKDNVKDDSLVLTDAYKGYLGLRFNFEHGSVNHHLGQYVNGQIHTNGIESFWALLKRAIKGTYIHLNWEHLFRYVDERTFAYNYREAHDLDRFLQVLRQTGNRRVSYKQLTGKAA